MNPLLKDLASAAARVANYCDHAEHCEAVDRRWAVGAAEDMRVVAERLAVADDVDLHDYFCQHVGQPIWDCTPSRGPRREQLALVRHDRQEHPDVVGRSRYEQLRHQAIVASVLVGDLASADRSDRTLALRVFLCGVRVSTVMFEKLDDGS